MQEVYTEKGKNDEMCLHVKIYEWIFIGIVNVVKIIYYVPSFICYMLIVQTIMFVFWNLFGWK